MYRVFPTLWVVVADNHQQPLYCLFLIVGVLWLYAVYNNSSDLLDPAAATIMAGATIDSTLAS